MIPERLERVRTATDTTITIMAQWDITEKAVDKINWKAKAEEVYQYLNDHSNEQFFHALALKFTSKEAQEDNQ